MNDIDKEKSQILTDEEKEQKIERKKRVDNIVQDIKDIDLKLIDNPYELILLLIEKANNLKEESVDILDFPLSDITSDYLKLMESIDDIDMGVSADFIAIASTLIKIKSERLLPVPDEEELIDAEEEERKILIATNEYKLFRDASLKMAEIEDMNKYYRAPAPFADNYRIVLKQMSVDNLIKAFTKMMQKSAIRKTLPVQTIVKDRWTVSEKKFEIETLLYTADRLQFFDLIDDDYTVGEIINLFLALLELVRNGEISIQQEDIDCDITIYKIEQKSDDSTEEYTYTDEYGEDD